MNYDFIATLENDIEELVIKNDTVIVKVKPYSVTTIKVQL